MINTLLIRCFFSAGFLFHVPTAYGQSTHLGVVGFVKREMTDEKGAFTGVAHDACLFPLFVKNKAGWETVENSFDTGNEYRQLPSKNWWIFYDGKSRDQLKPERTKTGPKVYNPQYELNCLNEKQNQGALTFLSKRNALGMNVLSTTNKNVQDPQHWVRTIPKGNELSRAKVEFIRKWKFQRDCRVDEKDPPWGTVQTSDRKLTSDSIDIDPRSFRSDSGSFLIGLRIKGKRCLTDVHSVESFYQKHWYFVSKESVKEIGPSDKNLSLEPLDAGDLAGDGKVEWIFRQNSVNAGSIGSEFYLFDATDFSELAHGFIHLQAVESAE
jgi:hypothetical protein